MKKCGAVFFILAVLGELVFSVLPHFGLTLIALHYPIDLYVLGGFLALAGVGLLMMGSNAFAWIVIGYSACLFSMWNPGMVLPPKIQSLVYLSGLGLSIIGIILGFISVRKSFEQ